MTDLFDNAGLQPIPLQDADLSYAVAPSLGLPATSLFDQLYEQTEWRQEDIVVWGKTHRQPRLHAWYGDADSSYSYSGILLQPLPWTPLLLDLKQRLEVLAGAPFNSVLLNYYRDQSDSMGMHSDDEVELGPAPIIASLSLGEVRKLVFRHRHQRDLEALHLPLASGSVLLMRGATQRCWKHGINKQKKPCGPRLNLTFRRVFKSV
ncbi:alpha-ketoglutarate-dependent dioxygenase AlkB [Halieaceae bacterium IMCC14734]|uniref:Alpha-ketoglutarate-dependent dioxygenase AlkB n=1 Tax=Candidatus Litorirhabdus singularis TaxID=2518993 RepID=A0ABT3TJ46_9GAMM|nr:alpha-ketoglutarate-dependent dioxygenase AlkB [Candidatus Litorirhabdus singularis]MCX2982333.1 alpha-ketoglutarate-dependent dioxygenase AlkB [Candidatus Litorirhabdus singularis]